jgi:phage gp36-like protein
LYVGPDLSRCAHFYSAPLNICRIALLQLRQRRGAANNGLGNTIKYLRQITSGAAGNGLSTTKKNCDAQRAAPRAKA